MKTKSIVYCFILAVGFLGAQTASAQTATQNLSLSVNGSAKLAVTALVPVSLSLGGATTAGAEIRPAKEDATSRLKISSMVTAAQKLQITAQVTAGGSVNKNTILSIQLLEPTAISKPNFYNYDDQGAPNPDLQVLSDNLSDKAAVTLVTDILTCWSGTADDDGYQINYKYESAFGKTPTSSALTTITFTILNAV